MEQSRLLELAGVTPLTEMEGDTYEAALNAVTTHLIQMMEANKENTGGDFGGTHRPQDMLDQIFKRLHRDVAKTYANRDK